MEHKVSGLCLDIYSGVSYFLLHNIKNTEQPKYKKAALVVGERLFEKSDS